MNTTRRQLLAQRASSMRKQMTYAERRLWFSFLREYPTPFVAQKVIGSYILDFYCRKARLSIELDGDSHYTKSQKDYDRIRTTYLEMLEIKELRFTNTDVIENLEGVCEMIHAEVLNRRNDVQEYADLFRQMKDKR
ncbi:endonuclease domain-containing protein [Eggerthella timonensis]|uniref:endonuclease domain-containing protein n=1 Tax=Eggerthella timonensis TaxID=1871008 RepID=UPI000C77C28C|nr:endonuclease domain-containing protein [Eggerthella timonensis]